MSTESPIRAAIYVRISKDRDDRREGVDRQLKDCRTILEMRGWTLQEIYTDNNVSASSRRVERPAYNRMVAEYRLGKFDALICWDLDRLTRQPRQLEDWIDAAEEKGLKLVTANGEADLTNDSGRLFARIKANVARSEVDAAARRIRRQKAEAAESGAWRGGRRPYGYERGKGRASAKAGLVLNEREAAIVRDCTTAVLAGRSLRALARELNERGEKSSTGSEWTSLSLRDVLLRPRNAALISRGIPGRDGFEIVQTDGKPVQAAWPPIVDHDTWRALHDLLIDPSRRTNTTSVSKWLLSGLASCGIEGCGATLRAQTHRRTATGVAKQALYRCSAQAHLTVNVSRADAVVLERVGELLRDPRILEGLTPASPDLTVDRERRSTLHVRRGRVEADYDAGLIDGHRFNAANKRISDEIAEIDARLAAASHEAVASPVLSAADPAAMFAESPVDVQKAIIAALVRVEVLPSTAGRGQRFDASRLRMLPIGTDAPINATS